MTRFLLIEYDWSIFIRDKLPIQMIIQLHHHLEIEQNYLFKSQNYLLCQVDDTVTWYSILNYGTVVNLPNYIKRDDPKSTCTLNQRKKTWNEFHWWARPKIKPFVFLKNKKSKHKSFCKINISTGSGEWSIVSHPMEPKYELINQK